MGEKNVSEELKKLTKKWENGWTLINQEEKEKVFDFSNGYKEFLDQGKTERESAEAIIKLAKENGFTSLKEAIAQKQNIKAGQKLYSVYKNSLIALFVIGKKDLPEGLNIIGSHIDAPRLD